MFVYTEIRNIETSIVGNFDECHTVIPTVYPRIRWSQIAQATRRPYERLAVKHIGVSMARCLMRVTN
jgi:hypothetical protein